MTTTSPFTLALLQMTVHGGKLSENLATASALIAEAASKGADIALLPECADLGWTDPSSQRLATAIPNGEACQTFMAAAKKHSIHVCCGLTESEGETVYNAAVLIDDQGDVLCKHRKLNELDIAHDYYAQGDRLNVAHTRFGTIGLMICADATAKGAVLSRSLGYMGADVILSPSSWAVESEHDNHQNPYGDTWRHAYGPVARDFQMTIAGVSNVGPITGDLGRDIDALAAHW